MLDVQEQLRSMWDQILYLQEQWHLARAQGLSDNPPPGYSPMVVTTRYSALLDHDNNEGYLDVG